MSKPLKVATALVGLTAVVVLLTYAVPPWFVADRAKLTIADRSQAIGAARTLFVQTLGGVALLTGLYFTGRTFVLGRKSERNNRFAAAVENIGKDSEAARAGGAYILYLLASEDGAYWPILEQLLADLIREKARRGSPTAQVAPATRTDVQAALTVLGKRPSRALGQKGSPLNLRQVDLRGYDLTRANLSRAYLQGADLTTATLADAVLVDASLEDAVLDNSDLSGADLSRASLRGARFQGANLYETTFSGADVEGAHFQGAENVVNSQLDGSVGTAASSPPPQ